MEGATLATVLLVSLYRTPESVEAAWKYFILCGVGIAQALFGTVLLFFAAERVVENRDEALLWSVLHGGAAHMESTVLALAFVFLLVGYWHQSRSRTAAQLVAGCALRRSDADVGCAFRLAAQRCARCAVLIDTCKCWIVNYFCHSVGSLPLT